LRIINKKSLQLQIEKFNRAKNGILITNISQLFTCLEINLQDKNLNYLFFH